jgi:hypothetical protein
VVDSQSTGGSTEIGAVLRPVSSHGNSGNLRPRLGKNPMACSGALLMDEEIRPRDDVPDHMRRQIAALLI